MYFMSKINKSIAMIKITMMGGIYSVCVTVYCKFSCDELLVQYCFKRQSCALGNASIFKCWKTFVKNIYIY